MIVQIIKDYSSHGVKIPLKGEFYKARRYQYDSEKVTLIYQTNEKGERLEKQHAKCTDSAPLCNEYIYNVKIVHN